MKVPLQKKLMSRGAPSSFVTFGAKQTPQSSEAYLSFSFKKIKKDPKDLPSLFVLLHSSTQLKLIYSCMYQEHESLKI